MPILKKEHIELLRQRGEHILATHPLGKRIKAMFVSTWDQIADDWLTCCETNTVKGDSVQEATADADRFDMAGDKEAAAAWRAMDRESQDAVLESIFPRKQTYGY